MMNHAGEKIKETISVTELLPEVLTKVTSMFVERSRWVQENRSSVAGRNWSWELLVDCIHLKNVSRHMRSAVTAVLPESQRPVVDLSAVQVMVFYGDTYGNGVPLPKKADQPQTVGAFLSIGRPAALNVVESNTRIAHVDQILKLNSMHGFSITKVQLHFILERGTTKCDFTQYSNLLQTVGGMRNLESLSLQCPQGTHNFDPNSPFLALLKLRKLHALRIDSVPPKPFGSDAAVLLAELLNRSPSNITNICFGLTLNDHLLSSMNNKACARITDVCCVNPLMDLKPFVTRLPNVRRITFVPMGPDGPDREIQMDELTGRLLDVCNAKKMEVNMGFGDYAKMVGEETTKSYVRHDTVIRVHIGEQWQTKRMHCPHASPYHLGF